MSDAEQIARDLVLKLKNKVNQEQGRYEDNTSRLGEAVRPTLEHARAIEKHLRAEPRLSSLSVVTGEVERHRDDVASLTITLAVGSRTNLVELRFDGTQEVPLFIKGLDIDAAKLATERFKRNFSPYGTYDVGHGAPYDIDFSETKADSDFAAGLFVDHALRFFMSEKIVPEG